LFCTGSYPAKIKCPNKSEKVIRPQADDQQQSEYFRNINVPESLFENA
jgi:hypothetical protein